MILTSMTIENFKGIGEPVHIDFKPVTLLFGPNSAGKSTIVQALHYAREIFERGNVDPDTTLSGGDGLDLGGFINLVHNHDLSLPIVMRFDLDIQNEELPEYRDWVDDGIGAMHYLDSDFYGISSRVNSCWVEITIKWSSIIGGPILNSYRVGIAGKELAKIETSEDGRQVYITHFNMIHPIFRDSDVEDDDLIRIIKNYSEESDASELYQLGEMLPLFLSFQQDEEGKVNLNRPINVIGQNQSALPVWGRSLQFDPNNISENIEYDNQTIFTAVASSLIVGPGEMVRDILKKFKYIGPIREVPKRNFRPSITYEESRWANGLAAWDLLYKSGENFIAFLNQWIAREDRVVCCFNRNSYCSGLL